MATLTETENREPSAAESLRNQRNARYGLVLFFVYLAFYGSFMVLNVVAPGAMKREVLAGMNLAIVSGFGLIAAALVLAVIYMALTRTRAGEPEGQ